MIGRIRTIKPEFFQHSGLFDAEHETGLPIRVAFAGLWTCCDREGRFKWRPRELKIRVLPYDDVDFSRVLDALTTRGFIVKYAVGSDEFGCIPSWKRHQVINNRESGSELPAPGQEPLLFQPAQSLDASTTRASRVNDASTTEVQGRKAERKGKEGNIKPSSELKTRSDLATSLPSQDASRLAQLLRAEIQRNKSDFRITPAQEQKWAATADRMMRLDGRPVERIEALIMWCQRDEFWRANVLSMDKLREKYDQLDLKANGFKPKAVADICTLGARTQTQLMEEA